MPSVFWLTNTIKKENMKREIKFKGRVPESNEWIYGSLIRKENIDLIGSHYITPPTSGDPGGDTIWVSTLVVRESVGQFTGMIDKNGKEIYEGDIVSGKPLMGWSNQDTLRGEVFFEVVKGIWRVRVVREDYTDIEYLSELTKDPRHELEVIGNRYEPGQKTEA